jgi:Glycosyl hydrolase catalytic core
LEIPLLSRYIRSLPFATLAMLATLGLGACQGVGSIGTMTGGAARGGGAAGVTGGMLPPGDSTGAAAGTGAAGMTGAAGASESTGTSGTSGTSGAAGAGSGAGAAGAPSAGAAGAAGAPNVTGAAGMASTTGAAGAAGTKGAAGATGAAGTGALPPVTMPHCKRGEAYQSNSLGDLQSLSKGISWWYNWTTSPENSAAGYATAGVEFVPMIWGGTPDPATIEPQIPAGAKYLLGFNEPNFGAQSHIPATQAAALWPKIEQIAHDKNLKIGSPAPNYCAGDCNDTDPIHYLDTFFAACTGCEVDFIAAHWYACTGDALTSYLSKLKKYGKPIWLTEFSCMDAGDHSAAGEQTYMKAAVQILENDPTIFRYSWFTGRWPDPSGVSLLGDASGSLTDLGNLYMTLPATGTCGQ